MRVISGQYKGLKLEDNHPTNIRPTTDKVKESLFNILQFEIQNKTFLDLFGGTGQIGIEAASRGARKVVIVDDNVGSINLINKNLYKIRNNNVISVIKSSSDSFLESSTDKFDIAFLDPPYSDTDLLNRSLLKIRSSMQKNSILAIESMKNTEFQNYFDDFVLQNRYIYGKIALHIYRS